LKLQQIEIEQQRMSLIENSKLSALGQMAAGIAHEVYNPLTVIQGKTLISKKNGNASSRDLDAILGNCRRIEKIIRSMTALARKEQKDAAENFEVSSWLEDVLLLCNEKMNREKIAFEVAIPEGLRITG